MKKIYLLAALFFAVNTQAQTTIFQDNFESGATNWQLNGGTGDNTWVVNNQYLGYTPIIASTPNQPGTFTGGVNSTYLHIYNAQICALLSVCNSNFDTGSVTDQSATMTTAANTSNKTNVTFSFWYLCAGAANVSYGTVQYSTDGTTWTNVGAALSGVSTWTQLTLTDPNFNNKPALKFRFRWINGATGDDPAFSVDEVKLTGENAAAATITTNAVSPTSACFNTEQQISVPFTATGTFTAGNIFTVQLSNASGSFAAPVSIGSMATSVSGPHTINAVLPIGTPAGTGYRLRVVSSAPVTIGSDNGTNFVVNNAPTVTVSPATASITQGQSVSLTAAGATTYAWTPPTGLSAINTATVTATPATTTTYIVTATDANGCTNTATSVVTVTSNVGISELTADQKLVLYPNPATEYFEILHAFNGAIEQLTIRDNNGRKVRTFQEPTPEKFFIADLQKGLYSVEIKIEGKTYALRLVIR